MSVREINFDGLIGPSHNYAGLSPGNLASARNAGAVSRPRAAALQGLDKMRANVRLGLAQGIFLPQWRPDNGWLASLGTNVGHAEPHIRAAAMSASSMWAANAATVSPGSDTADGRTHLTVANLVTMAHRSHEWPQTLKQLQIAFAARDVFAVHGPVPPPFGDEGAANHMRLAESHDAPGVEVFVYGQSGGPFPARQHVEASKAVARLHGLDPARTLFVQQSEEAIAAGAFHNDVVAVANEHVLFTHEQAFADRDAFHAALKAALPAVHIIEVPASAVSLGDAIRSYLFNAQLVTLPDLPDLPDDASPSASGSMALILPVEARETPAVWSWLEGLVAGNGPIRRLIPVDVRQSMANGGGPACLRLRVVADPAHIDPRFLVDEAKLDSLTAIVSDYWPEEIAPDDLGDTRLIARIEQSWLTLVDHLQLSGDLIP